MPTNFYMYFIVALIPLIVGAAYYHPKTMGGIWMRANGFKEEDLQGANMPLIFGLTYLFSLILGFFLTGLVIHQGQVFALMIPEVMESGSAAQTTFTEFMATYGDKYRTFSHGVVHGIITAVFFVLPLLAINAMFERRGWKYVLVHLGYWAISLALMGGILCSTLEYAPIS